MDRRTDVSLPMHLHSGTQTLTDVHFGKHGDELAIEEELNRGLSFTAVHINGHPQVIARVEHTVRHPRVSRQQNAALGVEANERVIILAKETNLTHYQ